MRILAFKLLLLVSTSVFSLPGVADHVVIVNPGVSGSVSQEDVERIFLAKTKTFPDGSLAAPVNQQEGTKTRETFDGSVIGKSAAQMKSYWAKLIFTGKAVPIKELDSDEKVIEYVASHPGAIGYVAAGKADDSVRVLFNF